MAGPVPTRAPGAGPDSSPTVRFVVLTDLDPEMEEEFNRIAATPRPLAGFVFSCDQATIDRFIGELSFGRGAVNQVNINLYIATIKY